MKVGDLVKAVWSDGMEAMGRYKGEERGYTILTGKDGKNIVCNPSCVNFEVLEMSDKVYYDESCYVCSLEINTVRKRAEACGIQFIDISREDFDMSGDYETEMIGEFDGEKTVGAETFRKMYETIGFKRTVAFSRLPVVKQIFNLGYYTFAYWVRPYLPKKRTKDV
ncbi:MAG: hypothetical protein CML56_08640 [Rhodobacteraceae bacterium]|nr:hypothetical protein [Paracoccaceae bacterium]